jgi:hypothetical protein
LLSGLYEKLQVLCLEHFRIVHNFGAKLGSQAF